MDANIQSFTDPNYVPPEYQVPYDILELPSQGILYKNKKKNIKVEFLTAMDENILSSPNISMNGSLLDILLERKVKEIDFDTLDLLVGDRLAILIYLRVTGFGEKYPQSVYDEKTEKMVEGIIDLSKLEQIKLTVTPDKNGLFDYELPGDKYKLKFKLLTGRDERVIEERNKVMQERANTDMSFIPTLRLEQAIQSIDGNTDRIKISNTINHLKIMDVRSFNKYISEIEPGISFKTTARIQGGGSVACFLRFTASFFWPDI